MIEALPSFLAVVDSGSIQGAAKLLNIARPTVKRRIEELEETVGVLLLIREQRGLRPTPAGEVFARRAREILDEVEGLTTATRSIGTSPQGVLRIGIPTGMPAQVVAQMTQAFGMLWPQARLELLAETTNADLIQRIDCRFALEFADPPESAEVVELGTVREQLVASRRYLETHPPIRSLDDLSAHAIFAWAAPDTGTLELLPVSSGAAVPVEVAVSSNDVDLLVRMACRDMGLALVPFEPAIAALSDYAAAELRPVLPEIVGRDRPRRLIVARALAHLPVVDAFVRQTRQVAQALDAFASHPS